MKQQATGKKRLCIMLNIGGNPSAGKTPNTKLPISKQEVSTKKVQQEAQDIALKRIATEIGEAIEGHFFTVGRLVVESEKYYLPLRKLSTTVCNMFPHVASQASYNKLSEARLLYVTWGNGQRGKFTYENEDYNFKTDTIEIGDIFIPELSTQSHVMKNLPFQNFVDLTRALKRSYKRNTELGKPEVTHEPIVTPDEVIKALTPKKGDADVIAAMKAKDGLTFNAVEVNVAKARVRDLLKSARAKAGKPVKPTKTANVSESETLDDDTSNEGQVENMAQVSMVVSAAFKAFVAQQAKESGLSTFDVLEALMVTVETPKPKRDTKTLGKGLNG